MSETDRSIDPAAIEVLERARARHVDLVWDRHERLRPLCGFGDLGLCCSVCTMGPCRIDPFGEGPQLGACGADAHLIVARNFARAVANRIGADADLELVRAGLPAALPLLGVLPPDPGLEQEARAGGWDAARPFHREMTRVAGIVGGATEGSP